MKRVFKKTISVIMCIVIAFSTYAVLAAESFAASSDGTVIPLIYVQGYGMPL